MYFDRKKRHRGYILASLARYIRSANQICARAARAREPAIFSFSSRREGLMEYQKRPVTKMVEEHFFGRNYTEGRSWYERKDNSAI